MRLQFKLNLTFAFFCVVLVVSIAQIGISSITSVLTTRTQELIEIKNKNLNTNITAEYAILEDSGLLGMENYVEATQTGIKDSINKSTQPPGWFSILFDDKGKVLASSGIEIPSHNFAIEFESDQGSLFNSLYTVERKYYYSSFSSWK